MVKEYDSGRGKRTNRIKGKRINRKLTNRKLTNRKRTKYNRYERVKRTKHMRTNHNRYKHKRTKRNRNNKKRTKHKIKRGGSMTAAKNPFSRGAKALGAAAAAASGFKGITTASAATAAGKGVVAVGVTAAPWVGAAVVSLGIGFAAAYAFAKKNNDKLKKIKEIVELYINPPVNYKPYMGSITNYFIRDVWLAVVPFSREDGVYLSDLVYTVNREMFDLRSLGYDRRGMDSATAAPIRPHQDKLYEFIKDNPNMVKAYLEYNFFNFSDNKYRTGSPITFTVEDKPSIVKDKSGITETKLLKNIKIVITDVNECRDLLVTEHSESIKSLEKFFNTITGNRFKKQTHGYAALFYGDNITKGILLNTFEHHIDCLGCCPDGDLKLDLNNYIIGWLSGVDQHIFADFLNDLIKSLIKINMNTQLEVLEILIKFEEATGEVKQNILDTFCGLFTGDKDAFGSTGQTEDDRESGISHGMVRFKYRIYDGTESRDYDLAGILNLINTLKRNEDGENMTYSRNKTVLILYFSMLYKHFCDDDLFFKKYSSLGPFRLTVVDDSYKYRLTNGRDGVQLTPADFLEELKKMGISDIFNNEKILLDFEKSFIQYHGLYDSFDSTVVIGDTLKVKTSSLCSVKLLPTVAITGIELETRKNELWADFIQNIRNTGPRDLTRDFKLTTISRLDQAYISSIEGICGHEDYSKLLEGLLKYIIYHTTEAYKEDISAPYGVNFNILLNLAKTLMTKKGVYEGLIKSSDNKLRYDLFTEVYVPDGMEVNMTNVLLGLNGETVEPVKPEKHVLLAYIMVYGAGSDNSGPYKDIIKNLLNIMADNIDALDRNDITAAIQIYSDIRKRLGVSNP